MCHCAVTHTLAHRYPSSKPDPKAYLKKGEGDLIRTKSPDASSIAASSPSPPKAGAFNRRDNPPNTTFRRHYERGDLPISVDHKGYRLGIKWKVRGPGGWGQRRVQVPVVT
jgi:hypothetical protein